MDAARVFFRWEENGQGASQGNPGIRDADQDFGGRDKRLGNEDGRSLAFFGEGKIAGIFREGEFAGTRVVGRGEAGYANGTITNQLAIELLGNLSGGEGHKRRVMNCDYFDFLEFGKSDHAFGFDVPNLEAEAAEDFRHFE